MKLYQVMYMIVFFIPASCMVAFPDDPIMDTPESTANPNVVTLLARDFPEFYALVEKAGMVNTLREMAQATVFAPVWYAFRKLAPNYLDDLSKDINKLRKFVGMHIMQGRISSYQLGDISSFPTLTMPVYIQKDGSGSLFVTPSTALSKVIAVNIPAKNGVIHVIDSPILPSNSRRVARHHEKN